MLWLLRRFIPVPLRRAYHATLVRLAQFCYGHPARRLTVVAVTGTSGKSTVVWAVAHLLEALGVKTGRSSTIDFSDGQRQRLNDLKMTMPGRFFLPRLMRAMVRNKCQVAVIEVTSEGIAQERHVGLDPDVAVFTNLTPEHIEAHGSFERYQVTKEKLFASLASSIRKRGQPKIIVVNADDEHARSFLGYRADQKFAVTRRNAALADSSSVRLTHIKLKSAGFNAELEAGPGRAAISSNFVGDCNVENLGLAAATALALGHPLAAVARAIQNIPPPPGRFEVIAEKGRRVIVDYAFHEKALEALYSAVAQLPHERIIHVLGGTGGGRDRWRRAVIGRFAGQHADTVIVTNEDPYDEDPMAIALAVAEGVKTAGKMEGTDLHLILDRRTAIRRAIELAAPKDVILVTGKASEQWIMGPRGSKVPWDDRKVVREELTRLHAPA